MNGMALNHRVIIAALAVALLAGCGGTQPPLGAPGAMPQGHAIVAHRDRSGSWMLPDAKSENLLYVATGSAVYVLAYPGGKLLGSLNVSGSNLCSDESGDVFIPTGGYEILEYAHGGTRPLQTLDAGDVPLGCAVDPVTGNLAVTQEGSGAGEVAIFPNAKPPAAWYRDPDIDTYGLCGYDDRGDLFVDGNGTKSYLAQLPKGSSTFLNYSLPRSFDGFGAIQWDGHHIAFSNPTSKKVYRLEFSRASFKVVGTTSIDGWRNDYSGHWPYVQTWLQGATLIAQASSLAKVGLWRYPVGEKAYKVLRPFERGTANIYGVTVSVAPSQ